ncbi:VOC family protein [Zeaxanthinibacter enoshimensis]|uniref:Catechol 2,3-dioxygenase-like lactoylglutathione lyase family enzyme n=1 Tax=Zeaxanthinibacter enoshimensis TaxID=392009 RepID=A0A4R6TN87_9FLAO|nr:VOC family protein [Zeaxanthinibacter enoshimensis]TDQ33032.1 catechol 2,3-dioxygenase-like lactoylglutathione lyase family enzyme [Zeaxanthinibacter enoshimensis]
MRVKVVSIPVREQEEALQFYTKKLGFIKKQDIPVGGGNRWLTVVAPEDPEGPEVLLEPSPNNFEPSKTYQEALFDAGIPCTEFYVDSLDKEYTRLNDLGVEFTTTPTDIGPAKIAILKDNCGNLIQLVEVK